MPIITPWPENEAARILDGWNVQLQALIMMVGLHRFFIYKFRFTLVQNAESYFAVQHS